MKKIALTFWAIVTISFVPLSALAKEPLNLSEAKQALIHYHNSGEYEKDIEVVINQALDYLKISLETEPQPRDPATVVEQKPANKKTIKPAIVLDIDETALSNFPAMKRLNFGGSLKDIQALENEGRNPVISPTLKLYQFAKKQGIAVFFISGRPEHELTATIKNLRKVGFTSWSGIMLRSKPYLSTKSAADFKIAMRKKISQRGYTILVNIGDQKSDLVGGYALKTYKLPNPYYHIA